MPLEFWIALCFAPSAIAAALLRRLSPLRRSKLGLPFRPQAPLPGTEIECVVPPRRDFIQLDVRGEPGDENIVEFANRWRGKWRANSMQAD